MRTLQDLKLAYKQETGLEPIITAYGFRPYLIWLEERLLQPIEPQEERIPDAGKTIEVKSDDPIQTAELKEKILNQYKKGNIVYASVDDLCTQSLKEFIEQPIEGILYDLNRDEAVVLTFIDDPKWVNDYAVAKTIRALKCRIDELEYAQSQQPEIIVTDEEIEDEAVCYVTMINKIPDRDVILCNVFIEGAKWMRDKLKSNG